jgi:hypothetical protein
MLIIIIIYNEVKIINIYLIKIMIKYNNKTRNVENNSSQ